MSGHRERAREAFIADITAEARRQLAREGSAALSLRSVARELGMVSSAVYRYVASRDELLTLLIVEAYGDLADAVEDALAGDDGRARWCSACAALRAWALEHPHDYALLYGSPVPGYAAPQDTIGPASRVYVALVEPLRHRRSRRRPSPPTLPPAIAADAQRVAAELDLHVGDAVVVAALGAIASLFGLISFELFGHTNNVITDHDAFFALRVEALADELGL